MNADIFIIFATYALLVSVASCDHGSNILIDAPDFDVCAQEGVEDCVPECDETAAHAAGYRVGFTAGQSNCPDPVVCDDEDDSDTDHHHRGRR